ncbi:TldD/PmbA family protein [Polymorphobacter sp.]|uniref:TldD/PmbA family protein n=1 Tax=Polymorphobacter sp. TaxID=1909290 RepID=UPI003F725189
MLTIPQALDRLDTILAAARTAGADTADALYAGDASTSIAVRLGQLEDVGRSEGEELGLRVFIGNRSASVTSSDLSPAALREAADRAVAMARLAPEDPHAGLAPEALLLKGQPPELDINDPTDLPSERLKALALAAEDAARAVHGVTNSEGGGAAQGRANTALMTSTGFAAGRASSSYSLSASVIAGEGAGMQRDYAWHSARFFADLEDATAIGTRAGTRATRRLAPIKLDTGQYPIVFDPRVSASLIGHFIGAITGSSITRGTSFLKDSMGQQVFAPGIQIIDDPLRPRGLRSRSFDGEGLPTRRLALIEDGILTTWLLDAASAHQLGLAPTGHASRGTSGPPGASASNLHIAPGPLSPDALIADIKRGLLVTELIGMGVNGLTGDYSRGAAGFLIEEGQITRPVAEITIAGNLKDMFLALTPANDLAFRHASNAPTLRVEGMTIAGA